MTSAAQREQAERIRADQRFWRALVAEVGRDRMLEPGPMGDWTFRDLTAHLAAWRNVRIPQIEAVARGEPAPPPPWPAQLEEGDDDLEAVNAWLQARDRDRTLHDVLEDYDRSFERLAAAIEALPDDVAADPNAFEFTGGIPIVEGDFTEHLHEEHLPGIRAWLEGRPG
ncbi:MAG: ClbS/DfsB family four-helix bundle protein [Chloroflexi bacterium]|nr:ClbS/DfsB family four-helix bundle protein [Chloroflexota bacterium]